MCFRITFKSKKEAVAFLNTPKIAKKDLIVYKLVDYDTPSTYRSSVTNFIYHKGWWYYRKEQQKIDSSITRYYSMWDNKIHWALDVRMAFHSWKDDGWHCWYTTGQTIVKFIIPAGTKYWENEKGEIVSEEIICLY